MFLSPARIAAIFPDIGIGFHSKSKPQNNTHCQFGSDVHWCIKHQHGGLSWTLYPSVPPCLTSEVPGNYLHVTLGVCFIPQSECPNQQARKISRATDIKSNEVECRELGEHNSCFLVWTGVCGLAPTTLVLLKIEIEICVDWTLSFGIKSKTLGTFAR